GQGEGVADAGAMSVAEGDHAAAQRFEEAAPRQEVELRGEVDGDRAEAAGRIRLQGPGQAVPPEAGAASLQQAQRGGAPEDALGGVDIQRPATGQLANGPGRLVGPLDEPAPHPPAPGGGARW